MNAKNSQEELDYPLTYFPLAVNEEYVINEAGRIYDLVNKRYVTTSVSSIGYLQCSIRAKYGKYTSRAYTLHRLLALTFIPNDVEGRDCVDHISRDRLDNSLENLRWCTRSENSQNRNKKPKTSSEYVGVCWNKRIGKWYASILIDGKAKHLGVHESEKAAAAAYNAEAINFKFRVINNLD